MSPREWYVISLVIDGHAGFGRRTRTDNSPTYTVDQHNILLIMSGTSPFSGSGVVLGMLHELRDRHEPHFTTAYS